MSFLVKNYMKKEIQTIEDTATIMEAAKNMDKTKGGLLVILKSGKPIGVVTEYDFVKKALIEKIDPSKNLVGEIMSEPIISVDPDEDLLKASEIMKKNNIRRLTVSKNGILYGIITATDIATQCGTYADQLTKDLVRWSSLFPII